MAKSAKEIIARIIRLDENEISKWLKDENGAPVKDPQFNHPYKVPNTHVIVVGNYLRTASPFMWEDVNQMESRFKSAGFKVEIINAKWKSPEEINDKIFDLNKDIYNKYPDDVNVIMKEYGNIDMLTCPLSSEKKYKDKLFVYTRPEKDTLPDDILLYSPNPIYVKDGKKGFMMIKFNKKIEFVEESKFKHPIPTPQPAPEDKVK